MSVSLNVLFDIALAPRSYLGSQIGSQQRDGLSEISGPPVLFHKNYWNKYQRKYSAGRYAKNDGRDYVPRNIEARHDCNEGSAVIVFGGLDPQGHSFLQNLYHSKSL